VLRGRRGDGCRLRLSSRSQASAGGGTLPHWTAYDWIGAPVPFVKDLDRGEILKLWV
jgi:hypothetical protein